MDARDVPLDELPGVGATRAALLARLGLRTVHDLLCLAPRRLEAWRAREPIAQVLAGLAGGDRERRIGGRIGRTSFSRFGRRSTFRVELADESGSMPVVFFNQPWLRERLGRGDEIEVLGRLAEVNGTALVASRQGSRDAPLPEAGALEPIYASTEGLSARMLRSLCLRALERFGEAVREPLDADSLAARGLPALDRAVSELHQPTSEPAFAAAKRRVALESLIALQLRLAARRRARSSSHAPELRVSDERSAELLRRFPFELTAGQLRVACEIRADLERGSPMRRLLQGDVGSGKTVLGLYACMLAGACGAQSAFLAPTELLAEQHHAGLREALERAGLRGTLLTGSTGARERRDVLARLAAGSLDVLFGTHALLGSPVAFARLAVAVIDEQHRFGVAQRERLFEKGRDVHGLLLTATPIPRSLALTLYGDLDVSVLREKPPGRAPVLTRRLAAPSEVTSELESRLDRGERAYWVVPRIDGEAATEDEEREAVLGAEQRFERMRRGRWAKHGVELVHGRLPADERAERLERFRRGEARLLVATTVIEVGVDVPEATAIVIESAERLGLAQLHQLRGRVGRGSKPSVCLLLARRGASERLALLERTNDGFEIAEADLRSRGMGDLVGLRQAGEDPFGLATDELDLDLLALARDCVAANPALAERSGAEAPLS